MFKYWLGLEMVINLSNKTNFRGFFSICYRVSTCCRPFPTNTQIRSLCPWPLNGLKDIALVLYLLILNKYFYYYNIIHFSFSMFNICYPLIRFANDHFTRTNFDSVGTHIALGKIMRFWQAAKLFSMNHNDLFSLK